VKRGNNRKGSPHAKKLERSIQGMELMKASRHHTNAAAQAFIRRAGSWTGTAIIQVCESSGMTTVHQPSYVAAVFLGRSLLPIPLRCSLSPTLSRCLASPFTHVGYSLADATKCLFRQLLLRIIIAITGQSLSAKKKRQ
jgi:hypothetical protein